MSITFINKIATKIFHLILNVIGQFFRYIFFNKLGFSAKKFDIQCHIQDKKIKMTKL